MPASVVREWVSRSVRRRPSLASRFNSASPTRGKADEKSTPTTGRPGAASSRSTRAPSFSRACAAASAAGSAAEGMDATGAGAAADGRQPQGPPATGRTTTSETFSSWAGAPGRGRGGRRPGCYPIRPAPSRRNGGKRSPDGGGPATEDGKWFDPIFHHGRKQADVAELFHVTVRTVRRRRQSAMTTPHRHLKGRRYTTSFSRRMFDPAQRAEALIPAISVLFPRPEGLAVKKFPTEFRRTPTPRTAAHTAPRG